MTHLFKNGRVGISYIDSYHKIEVFMKYTLAFILCLQSISAFALEAKKINGITLSILKGDLTHCATNVIVNAANRKLSRGSGVCGAIFSAAEDSSLQLQTYLQEKFPLGIETGGAIITPSFNLEKIGVKAIVHAVGPIYSQHTHQDAEELLFKAYTNSLNIVAQNSNLHSVAFPFISSGIYGFPKKAAAKIALKAVTDYAKNNPKSSITHVYFILNNDLDYTIFHKFIDKI